MFKQKGVEMLIMTNPIDDFVMSNLRSYNKRDIVDAESGKLDFLEDDDDTNAAGSSGSLLAEDAEQLVNYMKTTLGDKVKDVKVTNRLVDSPVVITGHESASLRRMSQFVQHGVRTTKRRKNNNNINFVLMLMRHNKEFHVSILLSRRLL